METNVQEAYNKWSEQYDTNINKTRDLEAAALRETLSKTRNASILEIGCGTGKNSVWLAERAVSLVGVDLSAEILVKAKEKVSAEHTTFIQADINKEWTFANDNAFDLITFSLVLEHISNLDFVFLQAANKLCSGGIIYLGELHPFKQYAGSKARFETEEGTQFVDCFVHNISDFVMAAEKAGLRLQHINEYFDDNNRNEIPRILVLLFNKK